MHVCSVCVMCVCFLGVIMSLFNGAIGCHYVTLTVPGLYRDTMPPPLVY